MAQVPSKFVRGKLLSKIQFNHNECIVRGLDGEVVAMRLRNGNLYKLNLNKVNGAGVAQLALS